MKTVAIHGTIANLDKVNKILDRMLESHLKPRSSSFLEKEKKYWAQWENQRSKLSRCDSRVGENT